MSVILGDAFIFTLKLYFLFELGNLSFVLLEFICFRNSNLKQDLKQNLDTKELILYHSKYFRFLLQNYAEQFAYVSLMLITQ